MPWICEECGALEDGDMCRSCGNIAAVGQTEPSAHPESMYAKQGLRTSSSFKYHSSLVGLLTLVAVVVSNLAAPQGTPTWPVYLVPAFFLAPVWVPPVHHAFKRIQESYHRWKFRDRL